MKWPQVAIESRNQTHKIHLCISDQKHPFLDRIFKQLYNYTVKRIGGVSIYYAIIIINYIFITKTGGCSPPIYYTK